MVVPLTTASISWGLSAAGWLISPVLSRFLNKCFDALGIDSQFQSQKQILLDKLEKLEITLLPKLLILTDAAQQSTYRPNLQKWLQKLKSAFYEAEHVLGLIEYKRLEKEVNSLSPSTSKYSFKKFKDKLPGFSYEEKDLIKSLENIEEIISEGVKFVDLLNLPSSSGNTSTRSSNKQYRQTISAPGSMVIGRNKDRDHIVNLLRGNSSESTTNAKSYSIIKENFSESSSNGKCYSVIGIWGMGGSGKTTLAQYVCDHEREANYFNHEKQLKEKYFDRVLWAHVSQNFNVNAILRDIWESGFKECPNFGSLEGLQSALQEKLRGERYFLVLDDVWCDKGVSEQELEQLFVPLRAGKRGSKILVTTRIEAAAKALGAMNPIPLRELDDEQFRSLFISNAIGDAQISDNHMKGRLISIGEKIAEKLCRSPLVAKTVAAQLRTRQNPDFWSSMLNKSLLKNTMGALFLSYQHLPPPLQRCFAFCSLFPKGYKFKRYHLVNLWIAEGFIETEGINEHMKDIGNQYILELISSSFFQVDKEGSYSMHDLIHDLAQDVSEGEYFRIESGEKNEIPAHTRHIYVENSMLGEYREKIWKLKDLRTIIIVPYWDPDVFWKEGDLDALFKQLRKLYVVEIEGFDHKNNRVPESVVQLRNLRYLNLENTNFGDAKFVSLCYQLRFLFTRNPIPNVGRLKYLQELESFDVRMERGFELKQLEHLKDLYGSLSISRLHNVKSKEEADRAKLSDKKGLRKLSFEWDCESVDVLRDNDEKVLDGLCPPPQIKELTIHGYKGKRFPRWISEKNDNIIHLQHLELVLCDGLEALSTINELKDLLSLTILYLPRLKSWVSLPLNLTQLGISNCDGLEALPIINELSDLLSLTISSLPSLKSWVPLPSNLTELEIIFCPNLASLWGLNKLTKLERLKVIGCDKLKCYSDADKLPQLKELCIDRFSLLEQLVARDGFASLESLALYGAQQEDFSQEECEKMFPNLSSLTKITFQLCEMPSLPNLKCLRSLINLKIYGCKNLSSLPDVPSVQHICIGGCAREFTWSCEDPNHQNWRKIFHIPRKDIW